MPAARKPAVAAVPDQPAEPEVRAPGDDPSGTNETPTPARAKREPAGEYVVLIEVDGRWEVVKHGPDGKPKIFKVQGGNGGKNRAIDAFAGTGPDATQGRFKAVPSAAWLGVKVISPPKTVEVPVSETITDE